MWLVSELTVAGVALIWRALALDLDGLWHHWPRESVITTPNPQVVTRLEAASVMSFHWSFALPALLRST